MSTPENPSSEPSERTGLAAAASRIVRQFEGPLTRQLLREPGGFGLGQVPKRLKPDATRDRSVEFFAIGLGLKNPEGLV